MTPANTVSTLDKLHSRRKCIHRKIRQSTGDLSGTTNYLNATHIHTLRSQFSIAGETTPDTRLNSQYAAVYQIRSIDCDTRHER